MSFKAKDSVKFNVIRLYENSNKLQIIHTIFTVEYGLERTIGLSLVRYMSYTYIFMITKLM